MQSGSYSVQYAVPEVYHFERFDKTLSYSTPRMPLKKGLKDENVVKVYLPLPPDLMFLSFEMAQFLKPLDNMRHFRR